MKSLFRKSIHRREPLGGVERVDDDLMRALVQYDLRARQLRCDIFVADVITDSSWPLVQELFVAHLAGAKMRTKELCAASGLPPTTVLRYLDHLERFDVVQREGDPEDSRVTLVSITKEGAFWARQYYARLAQIERQLAKMGQGLFDPNLVKEMSESQGN